MSALGRRRAACGPSLYFFAASGARPVTRRLWRVPRRSRPLGRRRAVCGSSRINEKLLPLCQRKIAPILAPIFVSTLSRGDGIWSSPGDGIGKDRRRARGRSAGVDGPGSGKIRWDGERSAPGSGELRWDGRRNGEASRGGRGQIPAAWRRRVCAPSGARRRSEVRVWSGGLGQFFARATPNKRQIDLWSRVVPPPGTRDPLVPGRGTTRY